MAHAGRCRYEWVQHETIAAASGVTAEEIAAIAHDAADALLEPADAAVIRLAAQAVPNVEVSAQTIADVRAELGDRQTVELLCLVGFYVATAIVARSAGIEVDRPVDLAVVEASTRPRTSPARRSSWTEDSAACDARPGPESGENAKRLLGSRPLQSGRAVQHCP